MVKETHRVVTSDARIDEAVRRASEYEGLDQRVERAEYQSGVDLIALHFKSGMIIALPRRLLQGLSDATPAQLAKVRILGDGTGLDWPDLDVQHYVPGLMNGIFGTRQWMATIGRLGGSARSRKKVRASRSNGRKGGRPKRKAILV